LPEQIIDEKGHAWRVLSRSKILRIFSAILVGLSFGRFQFMDGGQIGDSMEWKNGKTSISAGSDPIVLVWAVVALALFAVLMARKSSPVAEGVSATKRRILAFLIDFWFSLSVTSSIGALVPSHLPEKREDGQK
jgi:H+/Cl- antiporter ClcA